MPLSLNHGRRQLWPTTYWGISALVAISATFGCDAKYRAFGSSRDSDGTTRVDELNPEDRDAAVSDADGGQAEASSGEIPLEGELGTGCAIAEECDCSPGERRCNPSTGAPQGCNDAWQWQDDTPCGPGQTCTGAGECSCLENQALTNCGTSCVNLEDDANHCGACEHSCLGGACEGRTCLPATLTIGQSSPGSGEVLPTGPIAISVDDTHVYWTVATTVFGDQPSPIGSVRRVPKNGNGLSLAQVLHSEQDEPRSIVTDGTNLFWGIGDNTFSFGALRVSPVGGGVVQTVAVALAPVQDIVLSGDYLYWVEDGRSGNNPTSLVKRALKTSRNLPPDSTETMASNPGSLVRLGVAESCAYFPLTGTAGLIGSACPGSTNTTVFFAPEDQVVGEQIAFEVDNSGLYLLRGGVWQVSFSGAQRTLLEPQTLAGALGFRDVVTDDQFVYYIDGQIQRTAESTCGTTWSIKKVSKAGGGAEVLVPSPLPCPRRLAIDDSALYWTNEDSGTVMKLAK